MSILSKTATALFVGVVGAGATTNLYTHAPHGTWNQYPATIEDVSVSVKPKGIFSEVGMYLTISERGNEYYYYQDSDSQEIVLEFELPEEAVVNDLWLWVGDDIVQGKIMDKWTASSIYNGIVKQKKDPSIIYKQSATQYQIRVYPLLSGQSRKIKLSYLLPSSVVGTDFVTEIPGIELVKRSNTVPETANLILKPSPEGVYPEIIGEPSDIPVLSDKSFGEYKGVKLALGQTGEFPAVTVKDALKKGWYLTTNSSGGDNFFQVTTVPATCTPKPRKILFLLDYVEGNSDVSKVDLCNSLETAIQKFGNADSVNIVYSNLFPKKAFPNWVEGKSVTEISPDLMSDYSNMVTLLSSISSFEDAEQIVLISGNNSFYSQAQADELRKEIVSLTGGKKPVHVIDLCSNTNNYSSIGDRYFYNNEYLYTTLSEVTKGTYLSRCYYQNDLYVTPDVFPKQLQTMLGKTGVELTDFTMKTGMDKGFTYGEFDSKREGAITYASKAVTRIGKYTGTGPFTVDSYFELNGEPILKRDTIEPALCNPVDSTLRQFWYGFKINEIEKSNPAKDQIPELIEMSTENRVLSKYTSFLCLEPSDTVPVCEDCLDESGLPVDVKEKVQFTMGFSCIFANQMLKLNLPAELNGSQLTISLFNLKGQIVKKINLDGLKAGQSGITVNLGSEQIAAGNYIVKISGSGITHAVKITLL